MHADFRVVLDGCVLANAGVCDLFLRLAEPPRPYLPLWSETILDEVRPTQIEKLNRPWPAELAEYWRQEVSRAFPEARVMGHELLLAGDDNDEKDRHVMAAIVRASETCSEASAQQGGATPQLSSNSPPHDANGILLRA